MLRRRVSGSGGNAAPSNRLGLQSLLENPRDLVFATPATKAGCPIQAVLWLEWANGSGSATPVRHDRLGEIKGPCPWRTVFVTEFTQTLKSSSGALVTCPTKVVP